MFHFNFKRSVNVLISLLMVLLGLSFGQILHATEQNPVKNASGIVLDSANEPIVGANVFIVGTQTGVITDIDGKFSIPVNEGALLQVSFIGYLDQHIKYDGQEFIKVIMQDDNQMLDEVVMIGYGTAKKSSLTGALSQVDDKSFSQQKVTRIDQALQGRAAGVQVSNTGGGPGAEVRIRIRGANSILGDNSPLFVIDGFVGADFNDINPNDIESMEVLKDASSTAIYGSRGANGVILVTTKNGSISDKVNLSYEGSVSFSNVLKKLDMLSAGEFAEIDNELKLATGSNAPFTQAEVDHYYEAGGFDYQDAIFRTAIGHQHQLSISGGGKKTQFRVSGNYLNNPGIIRSTGYDRLTIRTNVKSEITKRLSTRFLLNGVVSNASKNNGNYTKATGILTQALAWAPVVNPYDGKGGYVFNDPYSSVKSNPLSMMYDTENKRQRAYANVLAGANLKIFEGLSLDFQAASSLSYGNSKNWSGNYITNNKPNASKDANKSVTFQTTTQLSYVNTLGKHDISAVAAIETQQFHTESLWGNASNLKFSNLKYDNLAQAESNTLGSGYSMWSLLSYIGRVNYGYDNRYLVSLSVRHDGSSKFAKGNRFSTFPSVALAWNIHNENFMSSVDEISTMKLRASWGLTGSQAIGSYSTLSGFNTNGQYYSYANGDKTSGIALGAPGNPSLKWETTEQMDLGLELGFLNNRIKLEADVFHKKTRDLLMRKRISEYQGGGSITSNIGSIQNNGIELTLSGDIISTKDVVWNSSINFSSVRNKVLDLGNEEYITSYEDFSGSQENIPEFIYKVGEPLGSIYGLKYLGPWQPEEVEEAKKYGKVPGDAKYEDINKDYKYDGGDAQIIGNGMPKFTLGWNNTFTYRHLTINAFFQGVFGLDKMNYTRIMYMKATNDTHAPTLSEIKDRYIPGVQEDAYLPAYSPTSQWFAQSSMTLENGSFLRLKNLSVAYDFDIKNVGSFCVSANATNLFTLTSYKGIDPEASNQGGSGSDIRQSVDYAAYPNSRTFSLGVSMKF